MKQFFGTGSTHIVLKQEDEEERGGGGGGKRKCLLDLIM
jgi:hypothetical protein